MELDDYIYINNQREWDCNKLNDAPSNIGAQMENCFWKVFSRNTHKMKSFHGENCQDNKSHKIRQKIWVRFLDSCVPTIKISGNFFIVKQLNEENLFQRYQIKCLEIYLMHIFASTLKIHVNGIVWNVLWSARVILIITL